MSYAIIIGRRAGEKDLGVILPPSDPRAAADAYKSIVRNPGDVAEIQLLDSRSGVIRRKQFRALAMGADVLPASSPVTPAPIPDNSLNEEGPTLVPTEPFKPKKR